MSNAVLPVTAGFKLVLEKIPKWGVSVSWARSAIRYTVAQHIYPIYQIALSVEVLRDQAGLEETRNLLGFFNQRGGPFDSFLYTDPDDFTVTDHQFGIRDGVATQFQLLRTYGGFAEPVQNVNALTNIKSNGVTLANPADYTINSTGLVTLAAAGTNGHVLTWTGTYYWRAAFEEDRLAFGKMFQSLWEVKKLALVGSVMNKV
jgi:uncharacterized protein (TIGR02217 family)